ncbi:MAG: PTH2 family peptidyl-tRNA hydrolase [Myxococcota bacterium]|jgi:PTH2 family peptidyl-tRNA hydrolase
MPLADFLGAWVLFPSQSTYEGTGAPQAGTYTILAQLRDPDGLTMHTAWSIEPGRTMVAEHRAVVGGHAVSLPTHPDMSSRTWFADGSLNSEVHLDGVLIHRTTRTLNDDVLVVDEALSGAQGAVAMHSVYKRARVKQVLVYRRDLKMRKGKIAAQTAHASMAVLLQRSVGTEETLEIPVRGPMAWWLQRGFAKVVLSVEDEEALMMVHAEAKRRGIPTALITDSGRTEFAGVATRTAVAIGPDVASVIDAITGPEGLVQTKLA